MHALLPILFIALVMSAVVGFVIQHAFLTRLRTHHTPIWEALGRPTLFLNNSITNSIAVLRFLWRREYQTLGDHRSVRLARFLRSYLALYVILFTLTIGVFLACIRR